MDHSASRTGKGPIQRMKPAGDDRERLVCQECGFINYENPRIIVGSVALWNDKILLCRRAIEPRRGFWTLPAGFLESNEAAAEGAIREAREEANAQIETGALLAIYSIPRISQVQLIYLARLVTPDVSPGPESLEVGLFRYDDIPWGDTAFPSVRWALRAYAEVRDQPVFAPRTNPIGDLGPDRSAHAVQL
ncbi:MAG: NUDIX hydrolase [Alphaproteobacteria bacterium]